MKILENQRKGTDVKISPKCYEILLNLIENNYSESDFDSIFVKKEDSEYFKKLFRVLKNKKILLLKDEVEMEDEKDVTWNIMDRCNMQCSGCIANALKGFENKSEVEFSKIINTAKQVINANTENVTITGGEPLMGDCFIKLALYINASAKFFQATCYYDQENIPLN